MKPLDWAVLAGTLVTIVAYGTWKTRNVRSAEGWLRGGSDLKWWAICLSIMATQASAITFLSMPGQAYEDGMGFVQFYFGLPVAMVILAAFVVPIYHRLKVYTAYEYLETRFDLKTRQLTAFLFLLQRGLAAGISIYAPAIILSTVLGWPLQLTNLFIGVVVILYTVSGGTRAVAQTQTSQMVVILGGMALAFVFILRGLPADMTFGHAVDVAGAFGKMNIVDFSPRFDTRYTFWSGLTGGLFVALAYFGTDQSQVQRYLSGSPLIESRLGLLMNGLVKVPMQLFILMVGLMVFVFYQFNPPPLFFNEVELARAASRRRPAKLLGWRSSWSRQVEERHDALAKWEAARVGGDAAAVRSATDGLRASEARGRKLRDEAKTVIKRAIPGAKTNDADYIFISFVRRHFPVGVVGLLIAVILCAAMSATASVLNALGSTTVVDFYKRSIKPDASDAHYLAAAQLFTVFWGVLAMLFAAFASLQDNLIQAVNILGSIFYGPTLGVFLVGFFVKPVGATAIFRALVIAQAIVFAVFAFTSIGFLWYNVIGCAVVMLIAGASLLGGAKRAESGSGGVDAHG